MSDVLALARQHGFAAPVGNPENRDREDIDRFVEANGVEDK